jgi:hypothetical protein
MDPVKRRLGLMTSCAGFLEVDNLKRCVRDCFFSYLNKLRLKTLSICSLARPLPQSSLLLWEES